MFKDFQKLAPGSSAETLQASLADLPPRLVKRITRLLTGQKAKLLSKADNIQTVLAYETVPAVLAHNVVVAVANSRLDKMEVILAWIKQLAIQLKGKTVDEVIDILLAEETDTDEPETQA